MIHKLPAARKEPFVHRAIIAPALLYYALKGVALCVEGTHISGAIYGRKLGLEISGHLPRFFSPSVLQL